AEGVACDIAFDGADPVAAEAAVRERLTEAPLDIAVQPHAGRQKRLLLADMDSTIITGETLDELAAAAGLRERIAAITARTMAGELDFAQSLRERVAMLAGLPVAALEQALGRMALTPGARTLVQTMKAHGAYTALVSGGFTQFTSVARQRCGFDEDRANQLALAHGSLSGKVEEPILDRDAKLSTLRGLCAERSIAPEAACTVGDGANDIPMLQAAGLGVAFRGKPLVRQAARFRVDHGDLTALLYLQGYRRDRFVTG
ncbi:MAG: phosphoserine phosphatase SerB, partial [Kiloniellales bacterium]